MKRRRVGRSGTASDGLRTHRAVVAWGDADVLAEESGGVGAGVPADPLHRGSDCQIVLPQQLGELLGADHCEERQRGLAVSLHEYAGQTRRRQVNLGSKVVQRPPTCKLLSQQGGSLPDRDTQGREAASSGERGPDRYWPGWRKADWRDADVRRGE